MRKIINKIMIVIILSTILAFSLFATFSIKESATVMRQNIEKKEYYKAVAYANEISAIFENAEGTVDALVVALSTAFNKKKYENEADYLFDYLVGIDPIIKNSLIDISDASALCFTFDPKLSKETQAYEIWYAYGEKGEIQKIDATLNGVFFEAFSNYDAPNMQYYFKAVETQGGVWTDPCIDPDTEDSIISYSRAVYVGDLLLGVVSADILTEHTIDIIRNMHTESRGKILLLNENHKFIISSEEHLERDAVSQCMPIWNSLKDIMDKRPKGLTSIEVEGDNLIVSYSHLSNDWILSIANYEDDIFASLNYVQFIIIILSVILGLITVITAYFSIRKFSYPVSNAASLLKNMGFEDEINAISEDADGKDDDIEFLVYRVIERQRQRDILMIHQSRQAQAGEMMANVAHQWKQPLNNINLILGNLLDYAREEKVVDAYIEKSISRTEQIVQAMSETIDDFMDYLKPTKDKEYFTVNKSINVALSLMESRLNANNISVIFKHGKEYVVLGYKNILYHVITNVLNNAVDAICENKLENGEIKINLFSSEETIVLEILNNGVPIPSGVERDLFKPYFTTKETMGGTGIGLSVSKSILEKTMNGTITLENTKKGVRCQITFKEGN